jgi:hypothetical protein
MGDAEPFKLGVYPPQALAIGDATKPESDVLNDCQMRKQGELLEDIADTPFANREIDTLRAVEEDFSLSDDRDRAGGGRWSRECSCPSRKGRRVWSLPGVLEGGLGLNRGVPWNPY